ncbi:MAG: PQQ-binding-like beta-propeller repeat protein [Desulfobacteraceae bacterium]|jgi:outer membrane protein assembly factor BamB
MQHNGKAGRIRPVAIWAAFAIAGLILSGCGQKGNQGDENVTIDSVVFTRTGLFLKMSEPVSIHKVKISKDGQELVSNSLDAAGEALVDFHWCGNTRYDLEVVADKATLAMPVYAPEKPSPVRIAEISLEELKKEEMEYRYYAARGTEVRFSPDGKYIGVGSKGGFVYLVNVASKKIVWKHKIPEARVAKVAFAGGGKLIAAEESRDGNIYCFDIESGKVLWQYKTHNDFKAPCSQIARMGERYKYYPLQIWGLCIDKANNCYVMVRHCCERQINGKRIPVTTSLVYKLNIEAGKPIWKFPINTSAWGLNISEDGNYIIPSIGWAKQATLFVLDGSSGKPLWKYTFKSLEKNLESFRGTTGFEARISPDSRYVVVNQVYPDHTLVFDNHESIKSGQAHLLWKKKFLKVLDVSNVPIGVSSVNLELTDTDLIFATWSTRAVGTTENNIQLPALHPDADTLFVYDYNGKLKWKWKLGEGIWNKECLLSENANYMAIPVGLVPETSLADPQDMGVYVFSPNVNGGATDRLNWFYHTQGFAYKADISPDGKHIVVLEGPFDIDPDRMRENIVGKHRLIILS